ncbi:MAG: cryptochrome/photolyase family protein [Flavobacteriales bacterium]
MVLFWHRRDLRIADNAGLFKALKENQDVQPIFIFDQTILSELPKNDQRVRFIHQEIQRLKREYQALGTDLLVFEGTPIELIPALAKDFRAEKVYTNRDYEPYALERDRTIHAELEALNIPFIGTKDHVIFEKNEVLKDDGLPYTIFTPYARKWKSKLTDFYLSSYPTEKYQDHFIQRNQPEKLISLEDLGFEDVAIHPIPERQIRAEIVAQYHERRDFPNLSATSKLSIHLRFGTISIRELARFAQKKNETYLNELIWRDFYQMIIFHFPHSVQGSFKKQYDKIRWEENEAQFKAWCEGQTGYPLVDAGMRELNETGFMHNRVRMVVASFLTKHLLIDWRKGEAYFAEKLLDFELASNIGGWQWAAGCGCDAAPYFRVFNPTAQQEKFDKQKQYIQKWVPEYGTPAYPKPIIDHAFARDRVLTRFKQALNE